MDTVTVSELNQQTAKVLDRVKAGESLVISEYGRPVARLVPDAPSTGIPLLDDLIVQGRAVPATMPGQIPPTPPRNESDSEIQLSEMLIQNRSEERY
jgi:prevent-host-death family protein